MAASGRAALRIAVVEPWSVLRRGLVTVLRSSHLVVADVPEVASLLPEIETGTPIDLVLCGSGGADRELALARIPVLPPLALFVEQPSGADLAAWLRQGVRGVLSRKVDDDELLAGVSRIHHGDRVIDQRFLPLLYAGESDPAPATSRPSEPSLLTQREQEVLEHLARGCTNREIADALYLGQSTVKTHLARIYEKLQVDDRHRAVSRALELGLLH